jgi:hypothetical protein
VLGVGEYGVECGQLVFSILSSDCRIAAASQGERTGWSFLSFWFRISVVFLFAG